MSDDKKSELNVLQLRNLAEVISRMRLSGMLGQSFQGNRDLYSVLGYKKDLVFQDYMLAYRRGSLGKRIINAPVDATWFGDVAVYENQEDEETEFEKKWKELNKKHNIIAKLNRFDKLVGMGQYAILLLGFNDGKDLPDPLEGRASDLIYLQPYHEGNCQIVEWEIDEKNPRYGRPNKYSIKLIRPGIVGEYKESRVHWTRAIHTAGECLENDVLGLPRMESCFNRLSDIDKLAGGSAEMFWQGALGGKAFSTKEGATLDSQTAAAMGEEIDEYIHGLRRYMRLQNMDVQNLSPDLISSPKDYLDIQLDLLAGDTGIPKRILVGSERGELASTQDESNWLTRIEQRRIQFAEPFIMRPFVDRLIEVGVLPEPKDGYQVDWPDLWSMSDQEQATVSKTRTETIAAYVNAPGIEAVIPEEFFLEEVVGFTREQVDRIEKMLEENPPEEIEEVVEPGGGESGKKSQDSKEAPIDNFNPYHGDDGRFTSGPGGENYTTTTDVNSVRMSHFTSESNVESIRAGGFSIGSNSMYGRGVYFTDRQEGRGVRVDVELKPHRQIVVDQDIDVPRALQEITGLSIGYLGSEQMRIELIDKGFGSIRFKMDDENYTVVLDPSLIELK